MLSILYSLPGGVGPRGGPLRPVPPAQLARGSPRLRARLLRVAVAAAAAGAARAPATARAAAAGARPPTPVREEDTESFAESVRAEA